MAKILITGSSGFIGYHLAAAMFAEHELIGVDFLGENDAMGKARLQQLKKICPEWNYVSCNIENYEDLEKLLQAHRPELIVHLAAKTGIGASLTRPMDYFNSNVKGFYHLLEACRVTGIEKIIYASSSSVYPSKEQAVLHEEAVSDLQLSFYGTTKRVDEVLAESYAAQFGQQLLGLRFFTVYGSWVRTDMAAWKFMEALRQGNPVTLYNNGEVYRDFTHVSDIVAALKLLIQKSLNQHNKSHQVLNIGNGAPVQVKEYFEALSKNMGKTTTVVYKDLPTNELLSTHADTQKLAAWIGFKPYTDILSGTKEMTDWYKKLF